MLVDSHVHLNDEALYPRIEEILADAKEAGVGFFVCIGYDRSSSELAIELASRYDCVYAAIGFHPSEARIVKEADFLWLEKNINQEKVVALGEIGLDYYWDKTFEKEQKAMFQRQIEIANKADVPLIIHMRDSINDTLEMLKQHKKHSLKGVMHCYSGSVESIKDFLGINMKISLAGPVTFKNAKTPKAVAKAIALEELLIETDAPYLAPSPHRGKQNESKFLPLIAEEIASIKNVAKELVEEITTFNAIALFGLGKK